MSEKDTDLVQISGQGAALKPLFGLDALELVEVMTSVGEPVWRGRQLAEAMYRQRLIALDAVTTFPKALREKLSAEGFSIARPRIAQVFKSIDGTERYLVDTPMGDTVETVWMPEGDDGEAGDGSEAGETGKGWGRATICVSSQVGCAVNCQFCLTAKLGLQRNLTAGEIAGQVIDVLDRHAVEVGRDRIGLGG